jgi:hypothetical protein
MIITTLLWGLLFFIVWKINQSQIHPLKRSLFFLSYGLKLLAGLGFYTIYAHYYGDGQLSEDAGGFVREAQAINGLFHSDLSAYLDLLLNRENEEQVIYELFKDVDYARYAQPSSFINETRNIIKLNSIFLLLSGGSIFGLFFCFLHLSFACLLILWSSLRKKYNYHSLVLLLLFATPSLLLWGSSTLKETVSLAGIALLVSAYFNSDNKKRQIGLIIFGIVLIFPFKPYWMLVIFISFILTLTLSYIRPLKWPLKILITLSPCLLFFSNIPERVLHTISDKQFDFLNVAEGGIHLTDYNYYYHIPLEDSIYLDIKNSVVVLKKNLKVQKVPYGKVETGKPSILKATQGPLHLTHVLPGATSKFEIPRINRSWLNLVKMTPEIFINVWMRPFATDHTSIVYKLFFLVENLLFLTMLSLSIVRIIKRKRIDQMEMGLIIFMMLFTLTIGYITPVVGALVRYRIPLHFASVILLLYTFSNENFKWLKKSHL